jgi:hypothetical protein
MVTLKLIQSLTKRTSHSALYRFAPQTRHKPTRERTRRLISRLTDNRVRDHD